VIFISFRSILEGCYSLHVFGTARLMKVIMLILNVSDIERGFCGN